MAEELQIFKGDIGDEVIAGDDFFEDRFDNKAACYVVFFPAPEGSRAISLDQKLYGLTDRSR